MDKAAFLRHLETMLELDPLSLTGEETLRDMAAWDSLAVLGIIAFFDTTLHKTLDTQVLRQAATVNDLFALVEA